MSTPPRERTLEGLCLKATPLGEQDRLLLLLTEEEGLLKLAASGARKPRSSLAAAGALTLICLLYTSPSPRDATLSRMPSSA